GGEMDFSVVGLNFLYAILGVVLMFLAYRVIDLLTPEVDFPAELRKGNVAVAIFIAAIFLSVAMVVAQSLNSHRAGGTTADDLTIGGHRSARVRRVARGRDRGRPGAWPERPLRRDVPQVQQALLRGHVRLARVQGAGARREQPRLAGAQPVRGPRRHA